MKKAIFLVLVFMSSVVAAESGRPGEWATPEKLTGIGNLYKVTDNLYRSERPTIKGIRNLGTKRIKTIINLESVDKIWEKKEKKAAKEAGLNYIRIKENPLLHVEDEDVIKFLQIIQKNENGPFLVHCLHGADRTGAMIAMFRIVEQRWSKENAIKEMKEGGYGFHTGFASSIIQYIVNVDVEKIRKEVGK
ncbi:MAG: dual specificity protein phosphatase family protein [Desulfomonilia bacterium]|jgi:protein tyrosine/serine phosphatase